VCIAGRKETKFEDILPQLKAEQRFNPGIQWCRPFLSGKDTGLRGYRGEGGGRAVAATVFSGSTREYGRLMQVRRRGTGEFWRVAHNTEEVDLRAASVGGFPCKAGAIGDGRDTAGPLAGLGGCGALSWRELLPRSPLCLGEREGGLPPKSEGLLRSVVVGEFPGAFRVPPRLVGGVCVVPRVKWIGGVSGLRIGFSLAAEGAAMCTSP